jgi:2-phospho-L-lactate guanylyltransferase
MTIWAIVPVKPLRSGKSRLAGALDAEERVELNRVLFEQTLKTLVGLKEVEEILVVSRDSSVLATARAMGARTVQEDGAPSLNTALSRATVVAQVYASRGVLVLPADLPLLTAPDVAALLDRAIDPPVVVIAPDRHRRGTNALILAPANLIEYDFGGNSFVRHCERATAAGARLEIVELPTLGLDLDVPEDLELVRRLQETENQNQN